MQRLPDLAGLLPIAQGLWSDEQSPRLIGGKRLSDGEIVFPIPSGDASSDYSSVPLSRSGTLWSWTLQNFQPKSPFAGPEPFEPYALGYVELPGEVIVETRLTGTGPFRIGMPMELTIVPFDGERETFAFQPAEQA